MGPALAVPAVAAGAAQGGVILQSGFVLLAGAAAGGAVVSSRKAGDAVTADSSGAQHPRIAEGRVYEIVYDVQDTPRALKHRIDRAVRILSEDIPAIIFIAKSPSQTANLTITSKVKHGDEKGGCWSHLGYVSCGNKMNLDRSWEGGQGPPVGTILHEFLHFLGVSHEHQRDDAHPFVFVDGKALKQNGVNLAQNSDIHPFRFDSASIMHYPSGTGVDPTKAQWAKVGQRTQLSQLDKLFVNMLYPPVPGTNNYRPAKGSTGLWYCGRSVMHSNNFPFGRVGCDGRCGPTNGPNCPSCIMYGISEGNEYPLRRGGASQTGETGQFYCGKRFCIPWGNHNGVCGPNNGPCCESCSSLID